MPIKVLVGAGPSCSGKSKFCRAAQSLTGWPIADADKYHDDMWKEQKRPLSPEERAVWEDVVIAALRQSMVHHETTILDCSALRHAMQYRLLALHDELVMVFLTITQETALRRGAVRRAEGSHFFDQDAAIADNLRLVEVPTPNDRIHVVDANRPFEEMFPEIQRTLNLPELTRSSTA